MRISITVVLALISCVEPLRVAPPTSQPPRRFALGVAEPFTHIPVEGVELAVHDSEPLGSPKLILLCLHAIGHGGGDFVGIEHSVQARWRVISIDWPGQGHSGPDPVPASAARYAQLLTALISQLSLEHVVLLGNSIGGAAALTYAAAYPETVTALILANPGGLNPDATGFLAGLFIGHLVGRFEAGIRQEASFEPWFRDYYESILITQSSASRREASRTTPERTTPDRSGSSPADISSACRLTSRARIEGSAARLVTPRRAKEPLSAVSSLLVGTRVGTEPGR